jgi:hypothetical protein
MTPLQEKFSRAVTLIEQWPDKAVVRWCMATLVRDQGHRVGLLPTAATLRAVPPLSPEQEQQAGWLINDALHLFKGPDE